MKLSNTYQKLRENWFSWTLSIQGTDDELDEIKYVTYLLHETFPNRRLVSTDRQNNFAETVEGWGEFLLFADVVLKSGETKHAELWLDLGLAKTIEQKQRHTGSFH